jgi:hypothetical protein
VGCPSVDRLSYDNIIGGALLDLLNLLNYKEFEFIREIQRLKGTLPVIKESLMSVLKRQEGAFKGWRMG